MRALSLIGRRLLAAVPVLFGVTLLTFFALNALPGSAAQQLLGPEATAAQVARLEAELHLDRPVWARYWMWLGGTFAGDLGKSLANGRAVSGMVRERLPATMELVGLALALSLGIALPLAVIAARRPAALADRLAMAVSMAAISTPSYVIALVLVLVFAVSLKILPSIGFTSASEGVLANIRSLTLPATAIALPLAGSYSRFLRGDLLEQVHSQDYILTAIAKGVGPWQVLTRHALRNSMLGLLTVVGVNFGALISGTVIIEQIFGIPGIGQLLLQAINLRDVVVVQAVVVVLCVATVTASLTVDLLYAVLDPRVRYGT